MSYSLENSDDLTAVANAIRGQGYGSENMTVAEMANAIASMDFSGGESGGMYNNIAYEEFTTSYNIPAGETLYLPFNNIPTFDTPFIFVLSTQNGGQGEGAGNNDVVYLFFWDGSALRMYGSLDASVSRANIRGGNSSFLLLDFSVLEYPTDYQPDGETEPDGNYPVFAIKNVSDTVARPGSQGGITPYTYSTENWGPQYKKTWGTLFYPVS